MQKRKQRRREAFAIHKQKIIDATILHVYPRCSHFEKTRKRIHIRIIIVCIRMALIVSWRDRRARELGESRKNIKIKAAKTENGSEDGNKEA